MRNNLPIRKIVLSLFALICFGGLTFAQTTNVPTIDGDGADAAWDAAPAWKIESVISNEAITDDADLSGKVKVLWSADSLYYKVEVIDDVTFQGTGAGYAYDNVAIYLDAYNKATGNYADSTIVNWEKFWAVGDHFGGRTGAAWNPTKANWAVKVDTNKMYTIELAVAWAEFGKVAQVSDVLGFDVKLSDSDGEDTPRDQLAFRDVSDMGWDKPTVFGEITLKADGTASASKSFSPSIDGTTSDRAYAFASSNNLTSIIEDANIESTTDLSGSWKAVWTEEALFVAVDVKDDSLYHGTGADYAYDNVVVNVDLFNKKTAKYEDSTQFFYEKFWAKDGQMGGRVGTDWKAPAGNWAVNVNAGTGYSIEIEVPFATSGFDQATATTVMGFDIKLSDCDGEIEGKETRDQITYMDITDGGWDNPSLFGEIEFLANGQIAAISARPAAPKGVEAVIVEDTIANVSWTAVEGMTYNVYRDGAAVGEGLAEASFSEGLKTGVYVYTVRAIDADGVLSNESDEAVVEVTVNVVDRLSQLTKAYPNPVRETLNVASAEDIQTVKIYNLSGAMVKAVNVQDRFAAISINDLDAGVYMVNVQFNEGVVSKRIIKE